MSDQLKEEYRRRQAELQAIEDKARELGIDLNEASGRLSPVSFGQLIDQNPELRPYVIHGILRRGETANLIAAAKLGKSFLAGGLAWSVATGDHWLGYDTRKGDEKPGRVLIIDNELHPETLANRLYRIAMDRQIDPVANGDGIDVICLRGQNVDIHQLEARLAAIKPGDYSLVILDALYRAIPSGTSENDNAQMMAIYNRLDWYAKAWDCAVAVVHHASKGYQGDKSITDVGAGAGSISRAADTHIVIRPHEEPGLSVMEIVTRSSKSPEPVSIRFEYPIWFAVATTANVKKLGQRQADKRAKDDAEADQLLLAALVKNKWLSESQIVRSSGMGPTRTARAIGRAKADGKVLQRNVRRSGRRVAIYSAAEIPEDDGAATAATTVPVAADISEFLAVAGSQISATATPSATA